MAAKKHTSHRPSGHATSPRSSLSGKFLTQKPVSKHGSITQQQANTAVRTYLSDGKKR